MSLTTPEAVERTPGWRGLPGFIWSQLVAIVRAEEARAAMQRDAFVVFAVRVASAGLLYVSQVVLARWMGSFDYGIYVFVWTWVLVLGGLADFGVSYVALRMVPEYRTTGELSLLRGFLFGSRLFVLASSTCVMVAALLALWLFGEHAESHYVLPAFLALFCIPLYALTDMQDGIGRSQAWMTMALVPPYILRPVLLLATMMASRALGFDANATTAAGAAIIATWWAGLIQTLLMNRRLDAAIPAGPREYDFRRWLTTAAPLIIINGSELVFQNTDILVISRYMSPADVGIYFAAAKTMSLIMFVHYAVGSAVAHRFSGLNAKGDSEGLRLFVRDAVNWTFWPSLAGAVIILVLGRPLLWLFGPEFVNGYPVMFVLVLGMLFRSAMGPVEILLNMLGEQKVCATVLVSTMVLNISLNFALVPKFGLLGAATATATSLVAAAAMNAAAARMRLGIDAAIWRNLPRR